MWYCCIHYGVYISCNADSRAELCDDDGVIVCVMEGSAGALGSHEVIHRSVSVGRQGAGNCVLHPQPQGQCDLC